MPHQVYRQGLARSWEQAKPAANRSQTTASELRRAPSPEAAEFRMRAAPVHLGAPQQHHNR